MTTHRIITRHMAPAAAGQATFIDSQPGRASERGAPTCLVIDRIRDRGVYRLVSVPFPHV